MNSLKAFYQHFHFYLEKPSPFRKILTFLGGLFLLGKAISLSSFIYSHFLRFPYNLTLRYGEKTYILVSTVRIDSLIIAFIEEFAQRGFNILVLCDENLKDFESYLTKTQETFKITAKLLEKFEDSEAFDISVLILHRSSGMKYKKFIDFQDQKLEKTLSTSIFTSLLQTKRILSRFAIRPLKSAIISLNSFTSEVPCPHYSLNSAINAFHSLLFRSLASEYRENVDVLSFSPLFVSEMRKFCGITSVSPKECVKECMRVLGKDNRSFGGIRPGFQAGRLNTMPERKKIKYFNYYLKRFLIDR